jgi:NAD(P)-dependent dehydrogenase (short-subunit alcohol dehydrogenase family)
MSVWFVTGASRGIGAEITRAALRDGHQVVATARNPQAVTAAFPDAGKDLLALRLDVTDERQSLDAAQAAVEHFGRIDVLVNNAGSGLVGAVEESSDSEVRDQFDKNVFGLLSVVRAVTPVMRRQRSGHIVNISTLFAVSAIAGYGVYSASKFAVEGISEAMHDELAPLGVRVTDVQLGLFRTDFLDASSLTVAAQQFEDYTGGPHDQRALVAHFNHAQPGDPVKAAAVIVDLVTSGRAPLKLPLGTDTVGRIEGRIADLQQQLTEWREVAVSTDYDDVKNA